MKSMMESTYGDEKWSKERELNDSMSIDPTEPDSYETAIFNVKGEEN